MGYSNGCLDGFEVFRCARNIGTGNMFRTVIRKVLHEFEGEICPESWEDRVVGKGLPSLDEFGFYAWFDS